MGYHVAESHLCHRICVTEGQLFTKLECLLYHKVNRYNNRLKTRKSFGSLKFYGLIITNSSLQNLNQQLTLRLWRETLSWFPVSDLLSAQRHALFLLSICRAENPVVRNTLVAKTKWVERLYLETFSLKNSLNTRYQKLFDNRWQYVARLVQKWGHRQFLKRIQNDLRRPPVKIKFLIACEKAIFICLLERVFPCLQEDLRRVVSLALVISVRLIPVLSQLAMLKASYFAAGEETLEPKRKWWGPGRQRWKPTRRQNS